MKIALLGYGKMGKTIENIALDQGHTIELIIDENNQQERTSKNLKAADIAIEFSAPGAAFTNIQTALEAGVPVVCGTTAWLDKYDDVVSLCNQKKGAFFYASNFSIGVNIFFSLSTYLAQIMNKYEDYDVLLEEIHHTQKLDAPSGTAITLAEGIIRKMAKKTSWVNTPEFKSSEIPIISKRIEKVPGTHSIKYDSEIDAIEIQHTAHSRKGFASGALIAAEWIIGKKGIFGMKDLLKLEVS